MYQLLNPIQQWAKKAKGEVRKSNNRSKSGVSDQSATGLLFITLVVTHWVPSDEQTSFPQKRI
jgi:hypothetical protein